MKIKSYISIIFTLLLFAGIYSFFPDSRTLPSPHKINTIYLIAAFLLFILNYILRTIRIKMLFSGQNTTQLQLFGITCLYGAVNYFMPARSGELVYLLLTKQHLKTRIHESSAHLLALRLYDALVINLSLPFILYYFGGQISQTLYYAMAITMLVINMVALLVVNYALRAPDYGQPTSDSKNISLLSKIKSFLYLVRLSLAKALDPKKQIYYLVLSIGIWLSIYSMFKLIAYALSYPADIFLMATISCLLFVFSLIPLQGVANFGPHEAAWTLGYSLIGTSSSTALLISLHTHYILLIFTSLLAAIGFLSLKLHKANR